MNDMNKAAHFPATPYKDFPWMRLNAHHDAVDENDGHPRKANRQIDTQRMKQSFATSYPVELKCLPLAVHVLQLIWKPASSFHYVSCPALRIYVLRQDS